MDTQETAIVKVLTPVPEGVTWWAALNSGQAEVVAVFNCLPETDDQPARPCREHLQAIRDQYPTHTLVYFD